MQFESLHFYFSVKSTFQIVDSKRSNSNFIYYDYLLFSSPNQAVDNQLGFFNPFRLYHWW